MTDLFDLENSLFYQYLYKIISLEWKNYLKINCIINREFRFNFLNF
jgi:hypothetical protein